jgi:hypothetical protein
MSNDLLAYAWQRERLLAPSLKVLKVLVSSSPFTFHLEHAGAEAVSNAQEM